MMYQKIAITVLIIIGFLLSACSDNHQNQEPIRIGINPWPGYEFLYLASEKGFFAQEGLNIKLVELSSLADVQRSYLQGRVDGIASTIIEAVQIGGITKKPIVVILVPDYSYGGDVIIANKNINSVADLKGKRIGSEIDSLGVYVLSKALALQDLSLQDVQVINTEQLQAEVAMDNGEIDAIVTYPPISTALIKNKNYKILFSTKEIPGEVVDSITVNSTVIANNPEWVEKFHKTWERAIQYSVKHKEEAYNIMAKREGITATEFEEALTGLIIVNKEDQRKALNDGKLKENIYNVCITIKEFNNKYNCDSIHKYVQPYKLSSSQL